MPEAPIRVKCTNPNLERLHNEVGTVVVEAEAPDYLLGVVWARWPEDGEDEIHKDNVQIITEAAYCAEVVENAIDAAND